MSFKDQPHPLSPQYINCIRFYAWGLCVGGRLTHHLVSETDRVLTKISHDSPGLDYGGILDEMDRLGGKGMSDWLQQGRGENEVFMAALVVHLNEWIGGAIKALAAIQKVTSVSIVTTSQAAVSSWQESLPLVGRWWKKSQPQTSHVTVSTIPLLDGLQLRCRDYKASLQSVLALGDVAGNPIPLDAQYLAEEVGLSSVLGNSRLVESLAPDDGLAVAWIGEAVLVATQIERALEWWRALTADHGDDVAPSGPIELGRDIISTVRMLDETNLAHQIDCVREKLKVLTREK